MKKSICNGAIIAGIIFFILFSIQIPASAFIPDRAIFEYIHNISTNPEIKNNILGLSFPWNNENQAYLKQNLFLENSIKIPDQFKDIQDLQKKSDSIQIIGDNYSYSPHDANSNELYIPLERWRDIPLDWILSTEPEGTIIVSSQLNNPNNKKITIPPATHEKGILLFSSVTVPDNEPGFSFFINGNISSMDFLAFLVKDTVRPDNIKIYSVPPGNYSNTAYLNLAEFSGNKTSLVLGASFLSEKEQPWIITGFSPGNDLEITEKREILPISDNLTDNLFLHVELPTPTETKYPNISKIHPVNILNIQTNFSINIYGEHFLPGAKVWIEGTDYGEIYSNNATIVSENNISAIFSNLNLPSDTYSVGVTNPDGKTARIYDALTIHTPNKPEIEEISPITGPNTGIFNITKLNITHF